MAKQTFTTGQVLTAAQVTALQSNDYNQTVSTKTANYVLVAADVGTRVYMNAGGATTITVNTGLFAAGDTVWLGNIGAGSCVVTAGTATVDKFSTASLTLSQYQGAYLYFISTGAAILYSDSAAASTPLTTKGDLFGFSTLNARVPIGTNNQVLTADSAEALGLKWATPASGGKVLQVSSGAYTPNVTTTSATYSDINAATNVSFTCSSVSSKVLIIAHINEAYIPSGSQNLHLRVMADSTAVLVSEGLMIGGGERLLNFPMMILYSPASTSAITYKLQLRSSSGGAAVTVNQNGSTGGTNINLLEIGA